MFVSFRYCFADGLSQKCSRPLLSSKQPHFQNEAKCTTFFVKMSFICMRMKNHFHIKRLALNLILIQRLKGTRKWPVPSVAQAKCLHDKHKQILIYVQDGGDFECRYRSFRKQHIFQMVFTVTSSNCKVKKQRGFTNPYLHQVEDKQKVNFYTSFHFRGMFHFENTAI